ncbi:MAG: fluoride efflux transporter CrcB [Paracoccaceae bacterium]
MMGSILQVALGGAIGAVARFLVGMSVAFPIGTLTVNVLGSFIMGLVFVLLAERGMERWTPLVLTGMLGGFTTFSAFSLDTFKLYEAGRIGAAGGYVLASIVLSLLALFLAVMLMRGLQT